MNLDKSEVAQFYKLWYSLVWGVNEKYKIIPHFKKPVYGTRVAVSLEEFSKIRNAMWDNPKWIDEFLADHSNGEFTEQERETIGDWRRYFVRGKFLVMKHLAKYSVLMSFEEKPFLLYGVYGISDPLKDTLPSPVPYLAELVLLPFNGKITYDSIISSFNVKFGSGMRSSAKGWYTEARDQYGIIKVLDGEIPILQPPPQELKKKKAKAVPPVQTVAVPDGVNVPKAMASRYIEIADIIAEFCDKKLDDEYKGICLHALAKLCRKRPSPIVSGRVRTWACGIVYAIGSNNFIYDKSQPINMTSIEISEWFGLSKSTMGNKAAEIKKMLNLSYANAEFLLKSLIANNPAIWYLSVNGIMADVREMPREIQEKAFHKGLIPYIPADKGK